MKDTHVTIGEKHYIVTLITVYDGNYQYRLRCNGVLVAQDSKYSDAVLARRAGVAQAFEHWRKTDRAQV